MTFVGGTGTVCVIATLVGALLLACNNPAATTSTSEPGAASAVKAGSDAEARGAERAPYLGLFAASAPVAELLGAGGAGGEGGSGPEPIVAPFGISTVCGDAILGADEECDDGLEPGLDACTDQCQTRDEPVILPPSEDDGGSRVLGNGRHPLAGSGNGFIATYVDSTLEEPRVQARLFNIWGQPTQEVEVSAGASPLYEANPVTAALPDGSYAVAWSDFDGDGSDVGVALRRVASSGMLGPLRAANLAHQFSQLNPDMLWTGSELLVAWEDYADAFNGPDLRYRIFNADMSAQSEDLVLADTSLPEAAVALAPFAGRWAAAYREGADDGREHIVVKVGDNAFRVGPFLGGPLDDRPALTALDATHLLVVFSAAANSDGTVPRIRYSVVDVDSASPTSFQSFDPLDDVLTQETQVSHVSPSAVRHPDGTYVAWRSEARPGDAAGDQVWLKHVSWNAELETQLTLSEPEQLLPRVCEGSVGDQRRPARASVALPPSGALAIAWDDYSHSQGETAGDPEVVVHYAPLHARPPEGPQLVTEDWLGTSGAAWPSQWTTQVTTTGALPVTIQANEGRVGNSSGNGTAISYVNDHKALDVEMVTKVRFNLNSNRAGFVARMTDTNPPSYVAARIGTLINDTWRIYAMVGATQYDIATGPVLGLGSAAAMFTNWAQDLDFYMRFRVTSNDDHSINVAIKHWLTDVPEPETWTMQGTATHADVVAALGNAPGRFGLYANTAQSNRIIYFDDFRATFYEGATHGDPTATPRSTPLERRSALYRVCSPESPCAVAQSCCFDDQDCAAGTSCQVEQNEIFGLGSHAKTCSVEHCDNSRRDPEELRADCGGADCAPCKCSSTALPGASNYCSTTNDCLCGIGEGACTSSTQCLFGLVCKGGGYKYGLPLTGNVCQPFHCLNRKLDEGLETAPDCGNDCGECAFDPTNGAATHCRVWHTCASGHGTCVYHDECDPGLICGSNKTGQRFGLPAGTTACVKAHCDNNVLDADETAKDCGGLDCGSCP